MTEYVAICKVYPKNLHFACSRLWSPMKNERKKKNTYKILRNVSLQPDTNWPRNWSFGQERFSHALRLCSFCQLAKHNVEYKGTIIV